MEKYVAKLDIDDVEEVNRLRFWQAQGGMGLIITG